MGTVEENRAYWSKYDWQQGGDEWSQVWAGTESLWWGTIYPRIRAFLPAQWVLEIAPGYGRFTRFLQDSCQRLTGVDLTERCVEACRRRFADDPRLSFHVNDGRSLPMVPDRAIDFAFTFDSLVHAEADVLESYLGELARTLTPDGVAFVHHSNVGAFRDPASGRVTIDNHHWRAESMSAALFREFCERRALTCAVQEIVNWGAADLTDCISIVTPLGSRLARPTAIRENPEFMAEALRIAAVTELYRLAPAPAG